MGGKVLELPSDELIEKGMQQELQQGETKIATLINYLISDGRVEDVQKITVDLEYRKILYTEYHIQ